MTASCQIEGTAAIEPFAIEVPAADLEDLHDRLARARWPDAMPGAGWERGVPLDYLKDLAEYWRRQYDWRAAEAELNALPQFRTTIDGQRFHFLHLRSRRDDAIPLLLLHGWPGSIVVYLDLIGWLSDDFHVVVPSLPGHGFSGPITEPGWTDGRMAQAFLELMTRLGYERFGAQGHDTGAFIAPEMGRAAPERLIGVHLNALITMPGSDTEGLTEREQERLAHHRRFRETGMGYAQIQGTRPQTIAYGLTDSPVAQLAWIVEKFKEWTDPARELPDEAVGRDRLLTNVMLYWLTRSARSAATATYERFRDPAMWRPKPRSRVPTAVAVFATDVAIRRFAEPEHTIVRWTEFDRGGHFAALEAPDLVAADLRSFFSSID